MGKGSDRRPETTEVPPAVVESEWERLFGHPPAVQRRLAREVADREAAMRRDMEGAGLVVVGPVVDAAFRDATKRDE